MAEKSRDSGVEGNGESNGRDDELGFDGDGGAYRQCASVGCKTKAMALTRFCYLHILCDTKQRLYKPCDYVIKRFGFDSRYPAISSFPLFVFFDGFLFEVVWIDLHFDSIRCVP